MAASFPEKSLQTKAYSPHKSPHMEALPQWKSIPIEKDTGEKASSADELPALHTAPGSQVVFFHCLVCDIITVDATFCPDCSKKEATKPKTENS